jgi:ATP-dependent DNA helicase RecG
MNDHWEQAIRRIAAGWPEWKRNIGHQLSPMLEIDMITLTTPVKNLKGCGPTRARALNRLGIETVEDLLHHFPSGYLFAPPVTDRIEYNQSVTWVGAVLQTRRWGRNFEAVFANGPTVTWYNGWYLCESIFKGSRLMVSGVTTANGGFINPGWKVLKPNETPDPSDLNTVAYPTTSGITSKDIGRLVRQCLDMVPCLPGKQGALWAIHRPANQTQADSARQWFKYDELLYFQLALAVRQARREQERPNVWCKPPMLNPMQYFPFDFTDDQSHAVDDIMRDLCRGVAMNRLLQGNVGGGKTAVAAYAAIVMAFNGGQTAILCPTEILARQHYETIKEYFERAGVKCRLMVGGMVRRRTDTSLPLMHTPDIIIGTTSLLSEGADFANLGLVIIDEQHKFGVEQRAALRKHGNPHVLVMTATPIPRTMAMTVFGDLDVSTIRSMPPGRRPVETYWIGSGPHWQDLRNAWSMTVRDELAADHQVYVVCPRIEALDDEMRAVEEVSEEYANRFPDAITGMLHGRMTPQEKQQVAEWWFSPPTGGGRILVSTTVVEVGVDNPNATVMVIEGAERFGLAQLHQLRGRVGRGEHQSYCFLLSDTDSGEARVRLRAMERTNDGFEIAEQDLKLRGPGDLLSTRQHGLPELKIASLPDDYDLLVEARKEARELVAKGPLPAEIQKELERRYGSTLTLGDTA